MKRLKNVAVVLSALVILFLIFNNQVYAAPKSIQIPDVNVSVKGGGSAQDYVNNIKLLALFTVLSLLPSILIMMTSFTRIIVVFSFLKNAMGAQQSIPNQVLIGLAIFLTVFIMMPTYNTVNKTAIKPYLEHKITQKQAIEIGQEPIREFMLRQTRQKDLKLFMDLSNAGSKVTSKNVPLYIVIPAFSISELKRGFEIGFLIYIPFLIIDLVVGSVLMSMGMMMLPPTMVSLPFKLLLFIMVDGWNLLVQSLIKSFT
ncbi:flagellar type III secretion system pore protein FliP [Clostridium oryzae]|uniref:Flagellar biosynthetic protein FliP n=1 Tax=Clostridium oryzae TaxID=1450648 RepID=A0A1V4IV19_9CLOT|nr:flagellar type III secretion system pore protein FliP [Clostridium oryzae]OPJ63267.1 flagellar biosynthetic protein FliP precursor [Clostridium oryzae]